MRIALTSAFAAALVIASAAAANAQDIVQQVRQQRDGTLNVLFASKPGVCGDGRGSISMHAEDNHHWGYCEPGPVRLSLTIAAGAVTKLRTYVGGEIKQPAITVSAPAAVSYLLSLAETARPEIARHAIFPALLADSVEPWPRLLNLARNQQIDRAVRKSAIFWLGQGAGEKATAGLKSMLTDEDLEVRKSAVFALSQLKGDAGVVALIDVVKNSKDPEVRKNALFWLGQKNDPRVLAMFEDILLRN